MFSELRALFLFFRMCVNWTQTEKCLCVGFIKIYDINVARNNATNIRIDMANWGSSEISNYNTYWLAETYTIGESWNKKRQDRQEQEEHLRRILPSGIMHACTSNLFQTTWIVIRWRWRKQLRISVSLVNWLVGIKFNPKPKPTHTFNALAEQWAGLILKPTAEYIKVIFLHG